MIRTKPSLVKYEVGGKAVISGGRKAFDAALEADESTKVPKILHTIYQRAFMSLFLISSVIESPYPPPDLIHHPDGKNELSPEDQATVDAAQAEQQVAQ